MQMTINIFIFIFVMLSLFIGSVLMFFCDVEESLNHLLREIMVMLFAILLMLSAIFLYLIK